MMPNGSFKGSFKGLGFRVGLLRRHYGLAGFLAPFRVPSRVPLRVPLRARLQV